MKMMDNTTMIITQERKVFEHTNSFPEGQEYFEYSPSHNELQSQWKVFLHCQVKSFIMMRKFKYGEESVMPTLLDNNTYMKYDKFNTHREDIIGWLKYGNPVISRQRTTREKISDALMLVYFNENEMEAIITKSSDNTDDPLK